MKNISCIIITIFPEADSDTAVLRIFLSEYLLQQVLMIKAAGLKHLKN